MTTGIARDQITVELVHALFDYDEDAGTLIWRHRARDLFVTERQFKIWNCRFAGKQAGTSDNSWYKSLTIFGIGYKTHRIIWAHQTGAWPEGSVDHINGNKSDNRMSNLRVVSHAINCRNQTPRCTNSSGFTGVSWNTGTKKWQASVKHFGKKIHLGYFLCSEEAHAAYAMGAAQLGYTARHISGKHHD